MGDKRLDERVCNRTACQQSSVNWWWNTSTRAWYCQPCAFAINEYNPGLCVRAEVHLLGEVERLEEVRADDKRVLTDNYNALWGLVYPDKPDGWEYPGQIINHVKLLLEEKDAEIALLREACKKALTCASLDSNVRALIVAALSGNKTGEG